MSFWTRLSTILCLTSCVPILARPPADDQGAFDNIQVELHTVATTTAPPAPTQADDTENSIEKSTSHNPRPPTPAAASRVIAAASPEETHTVKDLRELGHTYIFGSSDVASRNIGFGNPQNLDEAVRLTNDVIRRLPTNPSQTRRALRPAGTEPSGAEGEIGGSSSGGRVEVYGSRRRRRLEPKGEWPRGWLYGRNVREMGIQWSDDHLVMLRAAATVTPLDRKASREEIERLLRKNKIWAEKLVTARWLGEPEAFPEDDDNDYNLWPDVSPLSNVDRRTAYRQEALARALVMKYHTLHAC